MKTDMANEFRRQLDNEVESQPSAMCFEFAYQVKIATERIRFAIKSMECFAAHSGPALEANLQLFEALERLQSAELRFQDRWFRRQRNNGPKEPCSSGNEN
jgi:hypothetical protein